MRNVDIAIFRIAQTRVNEEEVKRWLAFIGCSENYLDGIEFILEQETITDPALLIALAAKRCYKSFEPSLNPNVTKVRSDWTVYLDNVLKSRHGSVCEHATTSFAIENVSRVFTAEMNRHRAGVAISEASMRFIRYDDIPSWLPDSIRMSDREQRIVANLTAPIASETEANSWSNEEIALALKKNRSQASFRRVYQKVEEEYKELSNIWSDELKPDSAFKGKKHVTSMMRRIVPMGVATGGVWTLNMRALRHIMALRASEAAEEEILHVWSRAGKEMVMQEPMLLGDFTQTPEGFWVPKYDKV
jgi:thymidylate synthase (FAD)